MAQVVRNTISIATMVAVNGLFIGLHTWMYVN